MARRILIISEDLVEPWDEGIKKFAFSIGAALAPDHPVRLINVDRGGAAASRNGSAPAGGANAIHHVAGTRHFATPALRRAITSFQPDAIVYVPSPSSTVGSFVRSFVLRRHFPRAKLGMVALIPRRHGIQARGLLRGTAPDVLFVPSYASLLHACDLSLRAELLPVGVDTTTFRPPHDDERAALRRAHGIPGDAFVLLHVGHLSEKRNLRALIKLTAVPNAHVVVIGSTSTPEDAALRRDLEAAGARVIREFVTVHEFYRLADAYVFPTIDSEGCVEIPLSVLEALASGLPVLARPFGGLRDVLPPGDDVRYFDTDEELLAAAQVLRTAPRPRIRDVGEFSWRAIAERVVTRLCDAIRSAGIVTQATVTPVDRREILRLAAHIASPYHVEDLSRHDSMALHAAGRILEHQKVSFIPIIARYGSVIDATPLAEFVRRDVTRFRTQRDEFERIRVRLAADRVETMLFKSTGMSPSFHYLSSNLDVLVPDGSAPLARAALHALGYVELLNVEEPKKFLFRRFVGDGSSFAFHLHEVVGWGVPFLDNLPVWRHARRASDDSDILIPGPSEALLVTLAHWFYEDKALSLGNMLLTAHALRSMDSALAEPAAHARGRGWEEGFWGALHIFEDAWKLLFAEAFMNADQQAELGRAPARYAAVRVRVLPYVRYGENFLPAQLPFRACKVAYYRKVLRDRRRSQPRKWLDVFDTLLWAVRWKGHVRSQPGLLVSISGVDGSGKSLQVGRLRGAFETCDVRVQCIWARGGSSKGVGAVMRAGKSVLASTSQNEAPTPEAVAEAARAHGAASRGEAARFEQRQRRLRNPVARWVFSVVYALDLVWPYVIKARALVLTGHVTVCDRYIYDALVDFALFTGTSPSQPPAALNLLRAMVPRPRAAFVLDVDPAEALRRKPEEGGTVHLAAGRTMFLEIAASHRLDVLPAAASAEEVQSVIARTSLDAFYARYGTLINWLLRSNPGQMNPLPETMAPPARIAERVE